MDDRHDHLSDELLLRFLDGELRTGPAHLEACSQCRRRLARMGDVTEAIEDCSASLTDAQPAERQRQALLAAMDGGGREPMARLAPTRRRTMAAVLPACAAAVVLAAGTLWLRPRSTAPPESAASGNGFIALPYSDENLSPEGAVVLEVEVPRSALLLAGMPAGESHSNGRIKAEVVVGADGLARAIRFLN